MPHTLTAIALLALAPVAIWADDAPTPPTLMTEPGKLLFRDDLNTEPGKAWRVAKGKWEVHDGALKAAELPADKHGAVMRHAMPFENVVFQFSFKLDGGKGTSLSINSPAGHACRVLINPTGFVVRKDSSDKNVTDKAAVLGQEKVAIKPGEWHTMVVELHGKAMLATLDGKVTAFGEHDGLKGQKSNFGLTVAGDSVSFKGLRVWEATAGKNWEANRAKLLEAKNPK